MSPINLPSPPHTKHTLCGWLKRIGVLHEDEDLWGAGTTRCLSVETGGKQRWQAELHASEKGEAVIDDSLGTEAADHNAPVRLALT